MTSRAWNNYTEEEREELRKAYRRRRKLRTMGRPASVSPDLARAHVIRLHDDAGMSFEDISLAAPRHPKTGTRMAQSTPSELYKGWRREKGEIVTIKTITRTTQDRILAIEVPAIPLQDSTAWVDPTGTVRRLQALHCLGFGSVALSKYLGRKDRNWIWRILSDPNARSKKSGHGTVSGATREMVREMYAKLVDTDPADLGVSDWAKSRAIHTAERHGYLPPHVWDEDTMDDPATIPDWTGFCGTEAGYITHLVNESLVCGPCKKAVPGRVHDNTAGAMISRYYRFSRDKVREEMRVRELTVHGLEERAGMAHGIVHSWLNKGAEPRLKAALRLGDYLDLTWFDLFERIEVE